MDASTDHAMLARADRVLGERTVPDAMNTTRGVVGPLSLPVREEDAQRCVEKLRDGWPVTARERAALEVVTRLLRPALVTRRGVVDSLPPYGDADAELSARWPSFIEAAKSLVPSVGRIDDGEGRQIGTGFLVAPDLVVTNRHVLADLTFGTDELDDGFATINFGIEYDIVDGEPAIGLRGSAAVHPKIDLALLRTASTVARQPLAVHPADVMADTRIVTIGYPALGNGPAPVYASIFVGGFGIKRASPGEVRSTDSDTFAHDCSTLGGSSGSPVVTVDNPGVVAVHFEGLSSYQNRAIDGRYVLELLDLLRERS